MTAFDLWREGGGGTTRAGGRGTGPVPGALFLELWSRCSRGQTPADAARGDPDTAESSAPTLARPLVTCCCRVGVVLGVLVSSSPARPRPPPPVPRPVPVGPPPSPPLVPLLLPLIFVVAAPRAFLPLAILKTVFPKTMTFLPLELS